MSLYKQIGEDEFGSTQSFFANYQGGDLSLSLIEFYKGEKLTQIGINSLYIYGANNYNENNISKATYTDRIEWVHKNIDNILRMDKVFLNKAENRFVFAAFCLNMRELHLNSQFEVKLPIFLDATCSGIQHLAGLVPARYCFSF